MPTARSWVTARATAIVTGMLSHRGTPPACAAAATDAAATTLATTRRPSLTLIEPTHVNGSLIGVPQRVADTVRGAHQPGSDLGAQPLDVAVDRPGAGGARPSPHLGEQLLARHHRAGGT